MKKDDEVNIDLFVDPAIVPKVRSLLRNSMITYTADLGFDYRSYLSYLLGERRSPYDASSHSPQHTRPIEEMENEVWSKIEMLVYEMVYLWRDDVLNAVLALKESALVESIIKRGICLLPSTNDNALTDEILLSRILVGIPVLADLSSDLGGSYRFFSKNLGLPHLRLNLGPMETIRDLAHLIVEGLCTEGFGSNGVPIFDLGSQVNGKMLLGGYKTEFMDDIRHHLVSFKLQRMYRQYSGHVPLSRRTPENKLADALRAFGGCLSLGAKGFIYLHEMGHFVYGHTPYNDDDKSHEAMADGFAGFIFHRTTGNTRPFFLVGIELALMCMLYANEDIGHYNIRTRLEVIHHFRKLHSKQDIVYDVFLIPILKVLLLDKIISIGYFTHRLNQCYYAASGEFDRINLEFYCEGAP